MPCPPFDARKTKGSRENRRERNALRAVFIPRPPVLGYL